MLNIDTSNPLSLIISTFISEDLAYLYGLFTVQTGELSYYKFIIFYTIGVVLGDVFLYLVGFLASKTKFKITQKLYLYLSNKKHKKTENHDQFSRFEEFLILTRFLPGSRIPTYTYCGFTGYSLSKFSWILALTSIAYTGLGVIFLNLFSWGANKSLHFSEHLIISLFSIATTIIVIKTLIKIRKIKLQYKQIWRPLMKLITRQQYPEFWSPYIFYLPFSPVFLFYFLTKGGLKTILSTNPAIKMAGLIGEKKSEIDPLLEKFVPNKRLKQFLLPKLSKDQVIQKLEEESLFFPLIIKPDSGMRGTGVKRVHNIDELINVLDCSDKTMVVQEYYPHDNEWGVFYFRYPQEREGHIMTITNKVLPFVIGDGQSSLIDLILNKKYVGERFDLIYQEAPFDPDLILEKDQVMKLTNKGSHSKGCLFLDGSQWMQDQYLSEIRKTFDKIEGFNIGRVDIKFPDLEALKKGEFKIIEINGAGGESANFYDPKLSKSSVYKIMNKQWRHAFNIGSQNRAMGLQTQSSYMDLLKTLYKY